MGYEGWLREGGIGTGQGVKEREKGVSDIYTTACYEDMHSGMGQERGGGDIKMKMKMNHG